VVVDTFLKAYPVSERRQDGKERLELQIKEGMGRGK
jgi:hypothetical protein